MVTDEKYIMKMVMMTMMKIGHAKIGDWTTMMMMVMMMMMDDR